MISGAFRDRRSAAGTVMREAKSVQRMPEAKLLGASMDLAEPHGRVGRQHFNTPLDPPSKRDQLSQFRLDTATHPNTAQVRRALDFLARTSISFRNFQCCAKT